MKRVVFSSVFEADFAEITALFAIEASPAASLRWENSIIRLVGLLRKFPELGRVRRDLHPAGIRTFGVKEFPDFLVFYRTTANEIIFLRVRYGGMDLTRMFAEE
jgi:plasmid stabilization system protein ParE